MSAFSRSKLFFFVACAITLPMQAVALVTVSVTDTPDAVRDVAVEGNTAYVANGELGLLVLDVSDPAAPVAMGRNPANLEIANELTYVANQYSGLAVIDLSNLDTPAEIGTLAVLGKLITDPPNTVYRIRCICAEFP